MKFALAAAAGFALLVPQIASAQDHSGHADHSAHSSEAAAKLTIDSPIEALMADAKAKAVVLKHLGGNDVTAHPMYGQFKAMSLKAVAPYSQGFVTEEMLTAIAADLAKL